MKLSRDTAIAVLENLGVEGLNFYHNIALAEKLSVLDQLMKGKKPIQDPYIQNMANAIVARGGKGETFKVIDTKACHEPERKS